MCYILEPPIFSTLFLAFYQLRNVYEHLLEISSGNVISGMINQMWAEAEEYPGWEGVGVSPHDSIDMVLDWGGRGTGEWRILIVGKAQYWNVD